MKTYTRTMEYKGFTRHLVVRVNDTGRWDCFGCSCGNTAAELHKQIAGEEARFVKQCDEDERRLIEANAVLLCAGFSEVPK